MLWVIFGFGNYIIPFLHNIKKLYSGDDKKTDNLVFCFQFVYVEHLPMYQLSIETKWVTGKNKDQAVTPPYLIQWFLLHSVHTKGISPCWRQLFKEHLLLFFGLPITRLLQPLRMCLSTYRARVNLTSNCTTNIKL